MSFPFPCLNSDKPETWQFGLSVVSLASPECSCAVKVLLREGRKYSTDAEYGLHPSKVGATLQEHFGLLDLLELPGGRVFLAVAHRLGFFCPDNKKASRGGSSTTRVVRLRVEQLSNR